MTDGPPSELGPVARLSMLKTHGQAWDNLAWAAHTPSRIFIDTWSMFCGVVLQRARTKSTLSFTQLPSQYRGIEASEWALNDVGINLHHCALDPPQDLLVVVEVLDPS